MDFSGTRFWAVGNTLSEGIDFAGDWRITEQLQSGGTEYVLAGEGAPGTTANGQWLSTHSPLPAITEFFPPLLPSSENFPTIPPCAQNIGGAVRYRLQVRRRTGTNNIGHSGSAGLWRRFTARRTA